MFGAGGGSASGKHRNMSAQCEVLRLTLAGMGLNRPSSAQFRAPRLTKWWWDSTAAGAHSVAPWCFTPQQVPVSRKFSGWLLNWWLVLP